MANFNNTSTAQELSEKKQAYQEALDLCDFHRAIRRLGELLCDANENGGFEGIKRHNYDYDIAIAIRLLGKHVGREFEDKVLLKAEKELSEIQDRIEHDKKLVGLS